VARPTTSTGTGRRAGRLTVAIAAVAALALVPSVAVTAAKAGGATVTPADRRAIDSVIDRYVRAALERRDPGVAWDLSGPDMRGSTTRAEWAAGQVPVYPFEPRGTTFHQWHPDTVTRDTVSFDMLFQPRNPKLGAITYSIELLRRGHGWVVNRFYPIATFSPITGTERKVVAANDFTPRVQSLNGATKGVLSSAWLLVPVGIFGAAGIAGLLLAARAWLRARRERRELVAAGRASMPDLPSAVRARIAPERPEA
jgi:hypothetical protein